MVVVAVIFEGHALATVTECERVTVTQIGAGTCQQGVLLSQSVVGVKSLSQLEAVGGVAASTDFLYHTVIGSAADFELVLTDVDFILAAGRGGIGDINRVTIGAGDHFTPFRESDPYVVDLYAFEVLWRRGPVVSDFVAGGTVLKDQAQI